MKFRADDSGLLAVPGAQLYWESTGSGPALLLVHAGIADHTMWDDDVPVFAAGHRVVTYDCRGYGRSAAEALEQGIAASRRVALAGVAHMVNLERPAEFQRFVLDFLAEAGA